MSLGAKIIQRVRWIFYFSLILAGLGAFLVISFFFISLQDLPRVPEPLNRIIETPPTEIFAATGA